MTKPATGEARSLRKFADDSGGRGGNAWFDTLPPEIQTEIVEGWRAGLGGQVITNWLRDEKGYTEASIGKLHNVLTTRYPRKRVMSV